MRLRNYAMMALAVTGAMMLTACGGGSGTASSQTAGGNGGTSASEQTFNLKQPQRICPFPPPPFPRRERGSDGLVIRNREHNSRGVRACKGGRLSLIHI